MRDILVTETLSQAVERQASEIERLRGLLREALEAYEPAVEWYWRVREALGDE